MIEAFLLNLHATGILDFGILSDQLFDYTNGPPINNFDKDIIISRHFKQFAKCFPGKFTRRSFMPWFVVAI